MSYVAWVGSEAEEQHGQGHRQQGGSSRPLPSLPAGTLAFLSRFLR